MVTSPKIYLKLKKEDTHRIQIFVTGHMSFSKNHLLSGKQEKFLI
jgi:hypothetical protein